MRAAGLFSVLFFALAAGAAPTPVPAPAPPGAATSDISRTIVGEIVSIDLSLRSVVIRESVKTAASKGKRETVTVALDSGTSLLRGRKPVTLEELRPKDYVVARYVVSTAGAKALSFRVADRVVRVPAAPGSSAAESARPAAAGDPSDAK
jgi:hypothetical protein